MSRVAFKMVFCFLLAFIAACSSGGHSEQISEDLADRMSDSLEFDGGELEESPMPTGFEGANAPQLSKVLSAQPLRIGDPFVIELETNFSEPQLVDRVLMQIVGSKKHFVIKTGVIKQDGLNKMILSGVLEADDKLKGLQVTMRFALQTREGILGLPRALRIEVTEEEARSSSATELNADSANWKQAQRPDSISDEFAPQIIAIEGPKEVRTESIVTIKLISLSNEATKVILTSIGNDQCLTTELIDREEDEKTTTYKVQIRINISQAGSLVQKRVLLFALQNSDGATGLFVPWSFILLAAQESDGDIDDERESILPKCEETSICCVAGQAVLEGRPCEQFQNVNNEEIYHSLCVEGFCTGLEVRKLVDPELDIAHFSAVNDFDISPSGKLVAAAYEDGVARVYDSENDSVTRFSEESRTPIPFTSVSFHPEKNQIAVGNTGGLLVSYNLTDESALSKTTHDGYEILDLAYSPDGTFLAISKKESVAIGNEPQNYLGFLQQDSSLNFWVVDQSSNEYHTVGFLAEGYLAYAVADFEFVTLNLNTDLKQLAGNPKDEVNDITDDSANWAVAAVSYDGSLFAAAGCIREESSSDTEPLACVTSRLEIKSTDKEIQTASFNDVTLLDSLITAVAFSPGGNNLAIAYCKKILTAQSLIQCDKAEIMLVNTTDGSTVQTMEKHTAEITRLMFDPYANQLISSDKAGLIYLWDISPYADENLDFCKSHDDCDNSTYCNFKVHRCISDQCRDQLDNNADQSLDIDDDYCQEEGARVEIKLN